MTSSTPTPLSSSNHSATIDITSSTSSSSSSSSSFLSLVDPIKYIQKRKWSPTTTTSSLLQAFSPPTTSTTTSRATTTATNSTANSSIPKDDNDSITTTIVDSLIQSTYIKPWLEYYQEVPRKIDLFPDLTKNFEEINHVISQKLDNLVRGNTQVLLLGAALGAAITAGVALGIGSVFVFFWNTYHGSEEEGDVDDNGGRITGGSGGRLHGPDWMSKFFLYPSSFLKRRQRQRSRQQPIIGQKSFEILIGNDEKRHDTNSSSSSTSSSQIDAACRQCLDSITVQLGKKSLGWCHVLRITAYLVQEDNDGISNHNHDDDDDVDDDSESGSTRKIFRNVLKEYPCNSDAVINIVYVKALENKQSMVQVEALVGIR